MCGCIAEVTDYIDNFLIKEILVTFGLTTMKHIWLWLPVKPDILKPVTFYLMLL